MKVILALIIFSIVVLFHELGHFLLAKKNGIGVTEFSLGMGPRLLSTVKGGTRYSLKLLPFGGSCAMVGEDSDEDEEGSFNHAPVWGRIAVIAAGPIFNFIMAFVFAMIIIATVGYDPATVLQVREGSSAEKAGLQTGDLITKFEGRHVSIGRDVDTYLALRGLKDTDISLTYERDGKKYDVNYIADSEEKYMLGFTYNGKDEAEILSLTQGLPMQRAGLQIGDIITSVDGNPVKNGAELTEYFEQHPLEMQEVSIGYERDGLTYEAAMTPKMHTNIDTGFEINLYREDTNALGVLKYGAVEVKYWVQTTIESLMMLVQGRFTVNDLSGPVGIVDGIGDSYDNAKEQGTLMVWMNMLYWVILLSANLGVMNLLPIPALDGGRIVFLLIEAIRGKEVNRNVEGIIHFAGLMLLMALMVFVMFNDIRKIF